MILGQERNEQQKIFFQKVRNHLHRHWTLTKMLDYSGQINIMNETGWVVECALHRRIVVLSGVFVATPTLAWNVQRFTACCINRVVFVVTWMQCTESTTFSDSCEIYRRPWPRFRDVFIFLPSEGKTRMNSLSDEYPSSMDAAMSITYCKGADLAMIALVSSLNTEDVTPVKFISLLVISFVLCK